MRIARGSIPVAALALASWWGGASTSRADTDPSRELLHQDSGGVLELEGESKIVVRGMSGTFSVRAGLPGELRFEARTLDNRRSLRPVALWVENRTLSLEPVEGDDGAAILVELVVSPELAVSVETHDSLVQASVLGGELRIAGDAVRVIARGLKGSAKIDTRGGTILVSGVEGDLELRGSGLEAKIEYATGEVFVSLTDSELILENCQSPIEGEVDKTTVTGSKLKGSVNLGADDSQLSFAEVSGGGAFDLHATRLTLTNTHGAFDVRTDAAVEFSQQDGHLKILGYGAGVKGTGSKGNLEIETDGAEVRLEQVEGTTSVVGQNLDVQILNGAGEIAVRASASKIVVKKAGGPLTLENEYGDIEVEESAESLHVKIKDGDVRLMGLKASLQLTSVGGRVEAGWVSLAGEGDSSIDADSGDVVLQLPPAVNLRIDVATKHGRIEADPLPGLRVSEDEQSASGTLGSSRAAAQVPRPTLRVRADGNVELRGAGVRRK